MIKLTKEQVLVLHSELIKMTGGSDGIRDIGLLDKKQYEDVLQWLLEHQI